MPQSEYVKALGQYFTPPNVANLMVELAEIQPDDLVLEPSAGDGVFVRKLSERSINVLGCEIDAAVIPKDLQEHYRVGSFLSLPFQEYDVVIGNPPYVRWKNMTEDQRQELASNMLWNEYFNSLCDLLYIFIAQSIMLLKDGGKLVFITPVFWFNSKHASNLRKLIDQHGSLDTLVRFDESEVFPGVGSSIGIWRFVKGRQKKSLRVHDYIGPHKVDLSDCKGFDDNSYFSTFTCSSPYVDTPADKWSFLSRKKLTATRAVENACKDDTGKIVRIGDIARVANSMVNGLEKAFALSDDSEVESDACIEMVKAKDMQSLSYKRTRPYIFLNDVSSKRDVRANFPIAAKHLMGFKEKLEARYDYGKSIPFWHWVFPRNRDFLESPGEKIITPRNDRITNKNRLRVALMSEGIYPAQDVATMKLHDTVREDNAYFVGLLSSSLWFQWVSNKGSIRHGVVDFSHAPLSDVPIRTIDWNNPDEVSTHDQIVAIVRKEEHDDSDLQQLDKLVAGLIR